MRLLNFIPIKLTLVLVLGILLGYYLNVSISIAAGLAIIFIILLSILFYKKQPLDSISIGITAMFTTLCIGVLSISLAQPKNWQDHYTNSDINKDHTWHIKITEVLKPTAFSNRYIGSIAHKNHSKSSGRLILDFYIDSTSKLYQVDDELIIHAKLNPIQKPLNPHQFNYKEYLNGLGIYHQMRLNADNHFAIQNTSITPYGIASSIRNKISHQLKQAHFGTEELGIIQALLLGQRSTISEETYTNYKNAGAVHILAVSGLHIGIILLLLQFLLQPVELLPKGKTLKLIVILIVLWAFALIAGFSASIIRAVTMFSFVAYAQFLNRPNNTFNIVALSMFALLLLSNPMLIFQVGFQMSYAAVFAILWIYPLFQRFWFPKNQILKKTWQLLSVSIAAQLGVLPISLFYFHQFPGLFFVSNLLIVPFLGLILGMGILVITLALLNMLPNVIVDIYDAIIRLMNTIIAWVAKQEAFLFKNISFDGFQLILGYILIIALITVLFKINYKKTTLFLSCVIGFQLYTFCSIYSIQKKEVLYIAHQTKNSILLYQEGNHLSIHSSNKNKPKNLVDNYSIAERIDTVIYPELQNRYTYKNTSITVIDSLGVYSKSSIAPDYLLLTQSPKINLERLLDSLQPKSVIADGSNYKSYINRWEKTCTKRKLPFHYTGEKGAYYFE